MGSEWAAISKYALKVSGTVTVGWTFYCVITLHVLQLISVHFCLFVCRKIWQRVNSVHVLPTKMAHFPSTVTIVSHVAHWDSYKTQFGLQTYKNQRFLDTIVSGMKIDNWSSSIPPPTTALPQLGFRIFAIK